MKRAIHPYTLLYLLFAALGLLALLTGCASRPVTQTPVSIPASVQGPRLAVVETAQRMLGTPYRAGGSTPRGFDCSGLVSFSYGHAGIPVPRTTTQQFSQARPIGRRELQPGDLVFFNTEGRQVSHVGIYVGQRRFVHAPSSGKRVSLESLDNPYWRHRIMGAGHYF